MEIVGFKVSDEFITPLLVRIDIPQQPAVETLAHCKVMEYTQNLPSFHFLYCLKIVRNDGLAPSAFMLSNATLSYLS